MSISVQSNIVNGESFAASLSCTFTSPNAGGNTIIAVALFDPAEAVSSLNISDSQDNSYSVLRGPDTIAGTSDMGVMVWRAKQVKAGANTVAITPVGDIGGFFFLVILEYPAGVCDGAADQFISDSESITGQPSEMSSGLTGSLAKSGELALAYGGNWNQDFTVIAGEGWEIVQQANGGSQTFFVEDMQPSGTGAIEATATITGTKWGLALLTIESASGGGGSGTGILANYSVGETIATEDINSIAPPGVDNGHIAYSAVYSGTLRNWNGQVGILFADSNQGDAALPTIHSGEGPLVRVQLADVTYGPSQGDRVKFLLYRTSAGDKLAKALSLIS